MRVWECEGMGVWADWAALVMRHRYTSNGKDGPGAEEDVFFGVVMAVTSGCGDRLYPHTQNLLQSPHPRHRSSPSPHNA